jgi:hypothetical protein
MTKSLARLVISIGLLGACAVAGDTGPKNGRCAGHGIHHGPRWRPLRGPGREGFSERAYAERNQC